MIIQCDDCSTRFNVPDDKVGTTGTKVRCSKCGAVFFAYGRAGMITAMSSKTRLGPGEVEAALLAAMSGSQPVARVKTQTLGTLSAPPGVAPVGKPRTSPFAKIPGPGAAPDAPHDPFAGAVAPTTPPFAQPGPPGLSGPVPPAPVDPFRPPSAPQPMLGMPSEEAAPSFEQPPTSTSNDVHTDPFQGTPTVKADPFQSTPTVKADPFAATPGGFGASSDEDPFGGGARFGSDDGDPFGGGADPFGGAPDPFAAASSSPSGPVDDPFAALAAEAAGGGGAPDPFAGDAGPPPPPATDPFAPGGDDGIDPFAPGQSDPFEMPKSPATPSDAHPTGGLAGPPVGPLDELPEGDDGAFGAPHSELAPATMIHTLPQEFDTSIPDTGAHHTAPPVTEPPPPGALSRWLLPLGPVLSGAVQVVLFAGFVVVAVSLARGGDPAALLDGDLERAFVASGAAETQGTLAAMDIEVRRRPTKAVPGLVVVTGRIENRGEQPVPAPPVEVAIGETVAPAAVGVDMDPFEVDGAGSFEDLRALLARPGSSRIAPGESAAFVAFVDGVKDGQRAELRLGDQAAPP